MVRKFSACAYSVYQALSPLKGPGYEARLVQAHPNYICRENIKHYVYREIFEGIILANDQYHARLCMLHQSSKIVKM